MTEREEYYKFIFNEFRNLSKLKKIKLAALIGIINKEQLQETNAGIIVNLENISTMQLSHISNFIKVNIYN